MGTLAGALWNPLLCLIYLVLGALFLTATGAVAWRRATAMLRKAWRLPSHAPTEQAIAHRDAFLSSLGASVGVGNVAGVATALHLGGPGSLFWMWVSALFGMSFRMTSVYLTLKAAPHPDDPTFATPMAYLERLLPSAGRIIAPAVAGLLIASGLVSANLIQSNSVAHALHNDLGLPNLGIAIGLSALVALVSFGGVRSIVRMSTRAGPWMLLAYLGTGLFVLASDPLRTLEALGAVLDGARGAGSIGGGVAGYALLRSLQYGVSRGVFSHGSGIGMAPFFHGANADAPARGALVAAALPVVDTLVVCTVTGLVILSRGFWQVWTSAYLTVSAFEAGAGPVGKNVVLACLIVFAFTTIVSWEHFCETCFRYLGGTTRTAFRVVFCVVTFIGPFFPVALVWSLGDVLIGLLIVTHLVPLTYLMLVHARSMRASLEDADIDATPDGAAPREHVACP